MYLECAAKLRYAALGSCHTRRRRLCTVARIGGVNIMSGASDFSVIIPVFNKWDLTRNCLESLARHTPEYAFEVIVADNASTDATAVELGPLGNTLFGERFTRLRFEENRNFGPACNAGALAAAAPLLFFLNNDTLLTPGWAPPLVETLRGEGAPGAVGPLLLYEDGSVQHLGVSLAPSGFTHLYRRFPHTHPVVSRRRQLQAITAAALMIPAELFAACGGFYEGYVNGFEDVELCLRIRERGKSLVCLPNSVIFHLESQTPGRKRNDDHNAKLLRERCEPYFYVDLHHHGARDGFSVFVDDVLDISLRLSAIDEAALTAEAKQGTPADWLRLTKEHPFWIAGKEMLAEALEREGKVQEALHMRAEIAGQLQMEQSYKLLIRAAARAGNSATLALAEKHLRLIMDYRENPEKARRYVRYILAHTAGRKDAFLERLYEEKLRAMGITL